MKAALKISFAYLAAVIGAGFASGSEISHYFVKYGKSSAIGVLISSLGFGLFAFLVINRCKYYKISDFSSLVKKIVPSPLQKYIHAVISLFMAIVLGSMISAFSLLLNDMTGLDTKIGALFFSLVCAFILALPEKTVINQTGILGMFISVFLMIMCIYLINNRCINVFSQKTAMTLSSVNYTSYNIASVCPLLCSASSEIRNRKSCIYTGIFSFLLIFSALGIIWCILSVYYGKINLGTLPMLTIALRQGELFYCLYALVIVVSILTSAVAGGFGLLKQIEKINLSHKVKVCIIITVGYFISSIGFSNIVSKLYNLTGIMAIILPFCLIINFMKKGGKR